MSLFDERDLVEIISNAYPGERLCRNPLLDRARKRQELLEATEARTDCRSDTARQAPPQGCREDRGAEGHRQDGEALHVVHRR